MAPRSERDLIEIGYRAQEVADAREAFGIAEARLNAIASRVVV